MSIREDNKFFLNSVIGGFSELGMPPQALPKNKKNKKWEKAMMNFMENQAVRQFRENLKFKDLYRMMEGKLSYQELSEVIPQLTDLEETLSDYELPTFLKHYDLIGLIVKALTGELLSHSDKFNVQNVDEIGTNDYKRAKTDLISKYIGETFEKELQLRLAQKGFTKDLESFQSPEEQQQYIQQLQQARASMTPPEIEDYMNQSWDTHAVKWAENTLESDKENFRLQDLDRQEFIDFLLTGRCFRHHKLGFDYYEPETWSPINTFFSQDVETKNAEDCDYIGRIHWYTPSQFVDRYGSKLTATQKEKILRFSGSDFSDAYAGESQSFEQIRENNFHKRHIVPFKDFYDHQVAVGIEELTGLPMSTTTEWNKDGSESTYRSFTPRRRYGDQYYHRFAQHMRDDLNLRNDLIQVTEGYFKSYERVGHLTFLDPETGTLRVETTTDDLIEDFLRENNIKKLKSVTLEEFMKNKVPNTIVYDYVPVYYSGAKASSLGSCLDEDLYLGVEKLDYQIKGNSNIFKVKAPVAGLIDNTSLGLLLTNFQVPYNIVMNQIINILEKEIGIFYAFDVNFLPSEYKEEGDTEEALMQIKTLAKDIGLFPIDGAKQNTNRSSFNQMSPVNMTMSGQLADRMQLAMFYQNKAFEQVGVTPQRMGAPVKYQTAEGVKVSQDASYAQTEIYFSKFFDYKSRCLEIHLNVAQYAQGVGKDIRQYYSKTDGTKAFLEFKDPDFQLRKFSILPVSNSSKRKELEIFKNYIQNTNTLGLDELAFAELISSDSFIEVMNVAKKSSARIREIEDRKNKAAIEQIQEKARLDEEAKEKEFLRKEYSNEKDRENKILVEYIESFGRAADGNVDPSVLNMLKEEANIALKKQELENNVQKDREAIGLEKQKLSQESDIKNRELALRAKELQERMRERKSNERIAAMNKN